MSLKISIAHDFICPWCWIGFLQADRLRSEFGIQIEWQGYELFPDELEWPTYGPGAPTPENRVATPSRFDFLLAADGIEMPQSSRPHAMRTHYAHEAVEYAKTLGRADEMIEILYQAYWRRGEDINNIAVLCRLAEPIVGSTADFESAISSRTFKANIVGFDDDAYRLGVYNVPTFYIGEKKFAEQPYSVLKSAVESHWSRIYSNIQFPSGPEERPYVLIDMVTTIDGKILSGERGESVSDLGSAVDHALMHRLEGAVDGVILGANTVRATSANWNPTASKRFVVSHSGDLPFEAQFFQKEAYVVTSENAQFEIPPTVKRLNAGESELDFASMLRQIKALGVERLLVLGGSEFNGQLLHHDAVDELFLTIAPKVRLGDGIPTYAGGEALPRSQIQDFTLVEHYAVGNEVFLRYRRKRKQ